MAHRHRINDVESELERAGGCGLFHAWLIFLIMVPILLVGANMGASIFEAMIPRHYCSLPYISAIERVGIHLKLNSFQCRLSKCLRIMIITCVRGMPDNRFGAKVFLLLYLRLLSQSCNRSWSYDLYYKAVPVNEGKPSTCFRYEHENTPVNCSYWFSSEGVGQSEIGHFSANITVVQCEDWVYDRSVMRETIVTEFSLVCGSTWAGYISQSVFMLGVLLGNVVAGVVSDRLGRRMAFLFCSLGSLGFGVATAFTRSYLAFTILRGLTGFFVYCSFPCLFILMSEFVVVRHRASLQQLSQCAFSLGLITLSMIAFVVRDWRHIQLALSVPALLSVGIWWLLPESPRWLLYNKREDQAEDVIKKVRHINAITSECAPKNGGEVSQNTDEHEMEETNEILTLGTEETEKVETKMTLKKYGALDVVRTTGLRIVSLVEFYQWFAVSCVYYGLTLNAAELGGDPFLNLLLASMLEMISNFIVIPLVSRLGRVPAGLLSQLCAGIMCIVMPYIPSEIVWLYIATSIVGKFFISISFSVMYIQVSELYPTPIRSQACGICNAWARAGGIASPLIAMLALLNPTLPYTVFGVLAVISAFLVLILPETNNQQLTSSIEEGEAFIASHPGPLWALFKKRL